MNTRQRRGPTGSTGTKYFPVHIDYNTMIKTEQFEPRPSALKSIKATVCFFLNHFKNVMTQVTVEVGDDSLEWKKQILGNLCSIRTE